MSATQDNKGSRGLLQQLLELGGEAAKPGLDPVTRDARCLEFFAFCRRIDTYALIKSLTYLVEPGRLPEELRMLFLSVLTELPLRPDGVRATTEYVFSCHPSSTVSSSEAMTPQTNGANITQEALNMAANLMTKPPISVLQETWYRSIAPQLFVLLDGKDGYDRMKVASYVIGFGILGRRYSGAPGKSGSHNDQNDAVTQGLIQDRHRGLESRHRAHTGSHKPYFRRRLLG